MVIHSFQHIVDAEISRLGISLNVYPYLAIDILESGPDSCPLEKIIAEKFPYVGRVFLEPLKVQLSDTLDSVLVVLIVLAEIQSEMAFMPVSLVFLVHLAIFSFRTHTRGITAKTQSRILDVCDLSASVVLHIAMNIFLSMLILVIRLEQIIPLLYRDFYRNLRNICIIPDILHPFVPDNFCIYLRLRFGLLLRRFLRLRLVCTSGHGNSGQSAQ
jgi:hypothetical protein